MSRPKKPTIFNRRSAIARGYRSGLEERISKQIAAAGHKVMYETDKVDFIWPAREAKYTPDFWLPSSDGGFFVETKGRWTVEDRQKHLLIKEQCPEVEVRFVFSNQNAKLYKGSPTSYAQFCDRHGFKYANKTIPQSWFTEGEMPNEPNK